MKLRSSSLKPSIPSSDVSISTNFLSKKYQPIEVSHPYLEKAKLPENIWEINGFLCLQRLKIMGFCSINFIHLRKKNRNGGQNYCYHFINSRDKFSDPLSIIIVICSFFLHPQSIHGHDAWYLLFFSNSIFLCSNTKIIVFYLDFI